MKRSIFLLALIAFLTACTSKEEQNPEDKTPSSVQWGLVSSTMQLVNESVDPSFCANGWTALKEDLDKEGQGDLVPLQKAYVQRFDTLNDFTNAAIEAHTLVNDVFPTLRISSGWPCFMENTEWQESMVNSISRLRNSGWKIELTLNHHDSYPINLDAENITDSGWVNSRSSADFRSYVSSICKELNQGVLDSGTTIYLINEPVSYLFNAYLGSGSWPPGGKRAGKSLAEALINMREGLNTAALVVESAGFRPAISKNIRPMTHGKDPIDETLEHVFNWWLLDALLTGCMDDNFDGACEDYREPSKIEVLGITFYGTMSSSDETVDFGRFGQQSSKMPLPNMNFVPTATYFKEALQAARQHFPDIEIRISEIGLSASNTSTMLDWLKAYQAVVDDLADAELVTPSMQIHTLFKSAEFSPGDWVFHLMEGCGETPCKLTPWGEALLEEYSQ